MCFASTRSRTKTDVTHRSLWYHAAFCSPSLGPAGSRCGCFTSLLYGRMVHSYFCQPACSTAADFKVLLTPAGHLGGVFITGRMLLQHPGSFGYPWPLGRSEAWGIHALVNGAAGTGARGPRNITAETPHGTSQVTQLFGSWHIFPQFLLANLSFEHSALLWIILGNLQISVQTRKSLFESHKTLVFLNIQVIVSNSQTVMKD